MNKELRRKQRGIRVAAVGSTADRHPADGGYQLHRDSGRKDQTQMAKS